MGVKQIYKWCDACARVVRTDIPECIHFGSQRAHRNSESTTVVFRSADGKISIPWSPDAKCPKGFVREEVKGARAVRKLEREMDAKDLAKYRHFERQRELLFGPQQQHRRENLKHIARNARHPFEKALAQAALDRSQRGYSSNYDPGNHRSE